MVSTASTSRMPSGANSGRAASYFLARHGTIETTYRSSRQMPTCWAKWFFTVAPIICCGDLQLDRCGISSGYRRSTRFTQPGQHDVNCGMTPPVLTRSRNSVVSSMIVRSAAKAKSKILVEADRAHQAGDERRGLLRRLAVLRGDHAADGRGDEADDHLGRVVDRSEHVAALAHVVERAAGAGAHALAAGDAVGLDRAAGRRGADGEAGPAELEGQHAGALDLGAGGDAPSAGDALVVVADDERVVAHDRHARPHVQRLDVGHQLLGRLLAQRADDPCLAAAAQAAGRLGPCLRLGVARSRPRRSR